MLENGYIVLFGDCGMEQSNLFKTEKSSRFFYALDTQEVIPITHRIHGCPPSWNEINGFFASIFKDDNKISDIDPESEELQESVEKGAENTESASQESNQSLKENKIAS